MDIKQIITSNLPDGVEIGEKTLSIIAKELKAAQGEEFIPKTAYSKQSEKIVTLESRIAELEGGTVDSEAYKTKVSELEGKLKEQETAHKEAVAAKEKELTDYKAAVETEKTTSAKQAALRKQLLADGANAKLADLLELKFDLEKIEIDGDKIKDWEALSKPVKEQYADVFGTVTTEGVQTATPPAGNVSTYSVDDVKKMSTAQINANWDQVKNTLQKGI